MCKERKLKNEIIHVLNNTEEGRRKKKQDKGRNFCDREREMMPLVRRRKGRCTLRTSCLRSCRRCLNHSVTIASLLTVVSYTLSSCSAFFSSLLFRTESLFLLVLKVDDVFVCCLAFIIILLFLFWATHLVLPGNSKRKGRPSSRSRKEECWRRLFIFDSKKKIEHQTRNKRKTENKRKVSRGRDRRKAAITT